MLVHLKITATIDGTSYVVFEKDVDLTVEVTAPTTP
jgi:hypothetical protein